MAFGGEYLFPEKWKVINDTPVDGQLSKTELNRRGAVEFHSKFYPADDWKARPQCPATPSRAHNPPLECRHIPWGHIRACNRHMHAH